SGIIHDTAKQIEEYRKQLAYKFRSTGERSILFIDEAEQLVPKTSGSMMTHSHNVEETNYIKDMILSAHNDGIIYAMATNDLDKIEPAIYQNSDRIGTLAYVGKPDLESRKGIISKLLSDRPATKALTDVSIVEEIAKTFEGCSIGEIRQGLLNTVRDFIKTNTQITPEAVLKVLKK
ncbi:AAA family ATPase, partial [bacterium]|nr:AAA family ATPase [bacterium]